MKSLSLQSPAKLNLYLKVLNKRPDGFHNIKTIFQRIDLFDRIKFVSNTTGKIKIHCDHPHVPTGPKNLIYKVIKTFQNDFKIDHGMEVWIDKNIPVAAGLAGGSSNAATTLLALNQLWDLKLTIRQLTSYAKDVGSDVAFFLYNTPWALGEGRGELIKPLKITTKLWYILVVPRIKMYSGKVYQGLNLQLTKKVDNANILIRNLNNDNGLEISDQIVNDLEAVVVKQSPTIGKLKQRLKLFNIKGVMVSGSGPSVFGIVKSQKDAMDVKKILLRRYSQVYVVRTW